MTTLSAIQAILRGRKDVPDYISGKMVKLETAKGSTVRYYRGVWYRLLTGDEIYEYEKQYGVGLLEGEWAPLPTTFDPRVGGACMLGVQALAMGHALEEFAVTDDDEVVPYFVHPDFMNEEDRKRYPTGIMWDGGSNLGVAQAKYPCVCTTEIGGPFIGPGTSTSVPEVIAHLNDLHDPRRDQQTDESWYARTAKIEMSDLWPESRIIDWLRGLGYNGGH